MKDVKINIAIGESVKTTTWANKSITWSDMVRRLSKSTTTDETHNEFINLPKPEQTAIKDVGGYVGGYLNGGKRKQSAVAHRNLITLDIDFAEKDFFESIANKLNYSFVLHGTHKHHEDSPRLRMVIPVDRDMIPDEFVAVSRRVAGDMGIELFDPTTFDPCRLMFWGSNPKDQPYYFKAVDREILKVDDVLARYTNWKDVSEWPTSEKAKLHLSGEIKLQEDPSIKKGIIGAFCRTYSITEAIETFLSDVYSAGFDGSYTFVNGTSANGLKVYEDKFAYSHHGTDPASGKQCNSFDLVRIHLFGHHDNNEDISKSYKMMEEFCSKDEPTKITLGTERLSSAKYDFRDEIAPFEEDFEEAIQESREEQVEDLNWLADMDLSKNGEPLSNSKNVNLIFENDARLKKTFRMNLFENRQYVHNNLPWRKVEGIETFKNLDLSGIRNFFDTIYKITGSQKIEDSLAIEFERNSYHPVRDYLGNLKWDGVARVEQMLPDYFGTPDDLYHREAMRCVMVAGVKRIFEPGCKFDLVLTLVGGQGVGKSTFVKKLGVDWFSDTFLGVEGTKAMEQINSGVWVMEIAELAGLKKSEVEPIKQFISKGEDTFRPAYGKTVETYKRQCIFIGTTNDENFLRDPTGNRRFLPVDVRPEKIKKSTINDMDRKEVDQLWAEAVHMYRAGVQTYMTKEAEAMAEAVQKEHTVVDERTGIIELYLDQDIPVTWEKFDHNARMEWLNYGDVLETGVETKKRDCVCIAELFTECLGKRKEDMNTYATKEINALMKTLEGWEYVKKTKRFGSFGPQKYFQRIK